MTLDVLGALDPDRVVGLFYALPEARRSPVLRKSASWSHHVRGVESAMPGALAMVEQMTGELMLDSIDLEEQDAYSRAVADMLREANDSPVRMRA